MDYTSILRAICPQGKPWIIEGFADAMPKCIALADLTTPLRLAHFLAQTAEESDFYTTTVEYGTGREYEGRKDLGNTQRGDGPRFKGMGLIQITGRHNNGVYGRLLGIDLINSPELLARFPAAALSAALYWKETDLNRWADQDDIRAVTRLVNGGYNGLDIRRTMLARAKRALNAQPGVAAPTVTVHPPVAPPATIVTPEPSKPPTASGTPLPATVGPLAPISFWHRVSSYFAKAP